MLSVGSRVDGRKRLVLGFGGGGGGRGGMEENELEEGEACSGQEDDSCVDPFVALSYIGVKLHDVLGHFQKDFEDGVSAENLGAKFGGYGSFLPSYQRSPSIRPQPKSPPRAPNHYVSRSPNNPPFEGANPSVLTSVSISKNNDSSESQSLVNLGKICTSKLNAGESVAQHDPINKPVNCSDHKTLKVRLKVGPENVLARNNAAIYSGLGLDISPSSSAEDSPYGSGGLSPEARGTPGDSPMTILQIMTCFSVPGGYLLSPLPDILLHLTKKESTPLKNCKTGMLRKGIPETCAVVADLTVPVRGLNGFIEKKTKSDEKHGICMEVKNSNSKDDISTILKREIDNETPEGQKLVSDALNIPLLSGSRDADGRTNRQMVVDSTKATNTMFDTSKKSNMILVKDRISSPEFAQDNQLESTQSIKNCQIGNSGNETTHSRGKLNSKTILEEKVLDIHKGTSSDKQIEHMIKVEKNYDTAKSDSIGYKVKKNDDAGISGSRQMSAKKATSYEQDGETTLLEKDQLSKGKRKLKESTSNDIPAVELTKENLRAVSSVGSKEKKKSSHARGDHSENKSKPSKSSKETSKDRSKGSHRNAVDDVTAEQVGNRTDLPEAHYKIKSKDVKPGHAKGSSTFTEKSNARPVSTIVDNSPLSIAFVEAPANAPLIFNGPNSDAAIASHAPVVIKENWVACDICQEWRLLPHWTDPNNLPKKWQCSMQTWLPELNKCHISEAVTTKALNALCQIPAPENGTNLNGHHEVAASTITSADVLHLDQRREHDMRSAPIVGKKKHVLKDESNCLISTKMDVNEYPSETNLPNKFSLGRTSNSRDYTEKANQKQKEKHRSQKRHSDGGDFIEKNGKHSKSKSKREVEEDGFRSSKKLKKDGFHYPVGDSQSNLNMPGREAHSMDNGFSTKPTGKNLQNYGGYTSAEDLSCDPKGHFPTYTKSSKDQVHNFTNGKSQEHFSASDLKKLDKDPSGKKRKIKEWPANQSHQERPMSSQHVLDKSDAVKEASSQSEPRKQKKAKVLKHEEKESDGRMEKGSSTRILLSGSREHQGMREGRGVTVKEQQEQNQGRAVSQEALVGTDYLKRDMDYGLPPAAATSSSSKVSGSRKSKASKANFKEVRSSPVESVSSSPLRSSSTEKLSSRRSSEGKEDVTNRVFSMMGSLRRHSHSEADGGSDRSGTRRKDTSVQQRTFESQRAKESEVLDSLRGTCVLSGKEANQLSAGKAGDGMPLKSCTHDLSLPDFEDTNVVGGGNNLYQHNKDDCRGPDEGHIHDQDTDHRANGPSQRKSGMGFSLRFKERDKSSKPDVDKGKLKVSCALREQKESYPAKNGSSGQYETDIDSHDGSTYHIDSRDENNNAKEKKDAEHSGKKDLDAYGLSRLSKQHKDFDSRAAGTSCSKSNLHENLQQSRSQLDEKSSNQFPSDRVCHSEMDLGRGKSQSFPPKDKHEAQSRAPQAVPSLVKGNKSELLPNDAVNGDATKVAKQSRKPDSQSSQRQATPSCPDASSPVRKDVHPAATLMEKEARNLKHTANRLKDEGLELESTGLYFEAALKFLHVAALREPPSFESAKHGDAIQSMQLYSETAKLCAFCAKEYEKCKEMAAAALAHKCVEVAYMKVAYYTHPSASKDRHELQAVLQIPPGESPSSSASDVDNLNNQGTLDKAASAKGTAPQIAGNHVITARNRPNFMRLLSYSHDLNCAFDATRKSQSAIAAASINLGKDRVDSISSVKKVLDFNFHNVEGLLRLVRLSLEAISR